MSRILAVVLAAAAAACGSPQPAADPAAPGSTSAPAAAAAQPSGPPPAESAAPAPSGGGEVVSGVVAESMNSGGYTYARLTGATGDTWIAATEMPLEKGADVAANVSVVMDNFHSRTLNRDFPKVAFVSDVRVNGVAVASNAEAAAVASEVGAQNGMPPLVGSHGSAATAPPAGAPAPPVERLVEKVAPAPGGLTVFQVWQKRADMSGKAVRVRGRIVKANYEIMGTNWYHVQDGTGDLEAGTHDLTVTSRDRVNVGDVVTIAGPITLGKDFGAGYAYDVMVEGASVVK